DILTTTCTSPWQRSEGAHEATPMPHAKRPTHSQARAGKLFTRVHCMCLAALLPTAIELRQSRHTSAPRSHSTPAVPSGAEIELSRNSAISAGAGGGVAAARLGRHG